MIPRGLSGLFTGNEKQDLPPPLKTDSDLHDSNTIIVSSCQAILGGKCVPNL